LLTGISDIIDRKNFIERVLEKNDEHEIKEYLLHRDHYISLYLKSGSLTEDLIGKKPGDLELPEGTLPAMVRRKNKVSTTTKDMILQEGDYLTIIGKPAGIQKIYKKYH
jgi:Trk K+ transport system NAD-binding subunit